VSESESARRLRVWRQAPYGLFGLGAVLLCLVFFAIGAGAWAEQGPEGPALFALGLGVLCLPVAGWALPRAKEDLELRLEGDRLLVRRGAVSHELSGMSGVTRAWLCQQEVGTAVGAGDATLHANWIFLERGEGEGRLPFPERFQDGDSRRVVAALQELLAGAER